MQLTKMPTLRFAPFKDEWVVKNLGDIAEKVNSGKTPLGGDKVYTDTGILFIRSQNVVDNSLSLENIAYIPESIHNMMKNSVVKANDILLNITGASLGRTCVVPSEFGTGNVNQHVCIIRIDKKSDPFFIQPILASEKGQTIFALLQTGGGREGLNFQSIRSIEIHLPTLPEQQKIATFFKTIDTRLAQLKKQQTLLEQYKKGVMQQLFSQQLRFKDKDGHDFEDWEMKQLGKLGAFFSGGTPLTSKKEYFHGNIPFIRSGEIHSNKTEQFITEAGFKNSSAKMVEIGDLLYALYGATSGEVGISKMNGAINQAILCIRTNLNTQFLQNYLFFRKEIIIKTYLQGGQGNLSAEILKSLEIPCPSLVEQKKIADFLSAIDAQLAAVRTQIAKTSSWKKGLLQQMFV